MAENVQNFKNFPILPQEMKMMVVDEMHADDRCRFSGASKKSNREAKSSKYYMDHLELFYYSDDNMKISVQHGNFDCDERDITLHIEKERDNKKYLKYLKFGIIEIWRFKLDDSVNLVEYVVEHFNNILESYQNQINKLYIKSSNYRVGMDFQIRATSFRRLEHLKLDGRFDGVQFLTRTQRPLKTLSTLGTWNIAYPMEKIYAVQDRLYIKHNHYLNNDQFSKLSAAKISMNIGHITEDHIYRFLLSWQNGAVERKLEWYQLFLEDSSFNPRKLFRLLVNDESRNNEVRWRHTLRHHKDARKTVRIVHIDYVIQLLFFDDSE